MSVRAGSSLATAVAEYAADDARGEALGTCYRQVRDATRALAAPLSPEDCVVQSMPDASPVKWHLAHTTWFFETFLLESRLARFRPYHPAYRVLFNSYYQAVGPQHPRPQRGLLSRPGLDEVLAYREHVDRQVLDLLAGQRDDRREIAEIVELGLHHEQQHQELILTDVKHLLAANPLRPAYRPATPITPASTGVPQRWLRFEEGLREIGHPGPGFSFDNERPRHREYVGAFELASHPVTNGEYLTFIEKDGYARPEFWLAEGFGTVCERGWRAPLYWEQRDDAWYVMTLSGVRELVADEPVCHVSFYEAEAFARFSESRLPTEAEWEVAAADAPLDGNFVESGRLHPAPTSSRRHPPQQLFGDVWEWTGSAYRPYPGFAPLHGAFGEYNGKFMANQMVLRGGSCATPRSHIRATYRNFFYPPDRWQFSGIRLARDARS
ncbi:MAG: ergothioneine biosynthesis protein EgtB [Deltaproteobacteria bacterium]|nr:MAG: ergothioneine biosynthesis protein EgtB [Deltaproteobacteria bacterium]